MSLKAILTPCRTSRVVVCPLVLVQFLTACPFIVTTIDMPMIIGSRIIGSVGTSPDFFLSLFQQLLVRHEPQFGKVCKFGFAGVIHDTCSTLLTIFTDPSSCSRGCPTKYATASLSVMPFAMLVVNNRELEPSQNHQNSHQL